MSFNLRRVSNIPNNKSEFIMKHHEIWRNHLKENNSTFFMLYDGFNKFLPELSTGALKLYLFYGFSSRNATGESWYGIDTLAEKLDTTSRSINAWNNELEDLGLIYRSSGNKSSSITYLIPYSDYTVRPTESLEEFIQKYKNNEYISSTLGNIKKVYHFFQWRKGKDNKSYDKPLNIAVVECMQEYKLMKSNTTDRRTKRFVFNLTQTQECDYNLSNKYMDDKTPILRFDSTLQLDGIDHENIGVIINPKYNLLSHDVFEDILKEFDNHIDFNYYKHYNDL